jgi:glycosyltransferase A (GT-A) superfamily protein (DUF2064 family)
MASVRVPYDVTSPAVSEQIMERLMETLSDRQSRLLLYVGEHYGSATRATVEHMLSEFTTAMTAGQSIADRMKSYETIYHGSLQAGITNAIDAMQISALAATIAHGGRLDFRVTQSHKGDYAVRVRPPQDE